MNEGWPGFLRRWAIVTLGVLVAAHVVPGISYHAAGDLVVASLVLGLLNALRPFLAFLVLPILVATIGLFWFVLNALLLWLVGSVVPGFHVDGFLPAFFGGLVISFVSFILNLILGQGPKVQVRRTRGSQSPKAGGGSGPEPGSDPRLRTIRKPRDVGDGPVIDI